MLQPNSISIRNFKSFRSLEEFYFPSKPGLVFLTGQNEVDVGLSSNGVGKSTLFDALHWVLYGTSARGLKAGNVCSWGESGDTMVSCNLDTRDGNVDVTRTWRPNSLKANNQEIGQEELEALIGLNSIEFKNSVLMGQFNPFFLDLKPADKLNLFTAVMDLDLWTEASVKASSFSREIEVDELPSLRDQSSNLQGVVDYQQNQLNQLKAQADNFERHKSAQLRQMEDELKIKRRELEEAEQRKENVLSDLDKAGGDVLAAEQALEELQDTKPSEPEELRTLEQEVVRINTQLEYKNKQLEIYEEDTCPTCGQTLQFQENQARTIEEEITALEFQLQETHSKTIALKGEMEQDEANYRETLAAVRGLKAEATAHQKRVYSQSTKCSTAQMGAFNKVKALESRIHEVANSTNRAREDMERIGKEKEANLKRLKSINRELSDLEKMQQAVQFWVKGFREIRLFLVEEALASLEMESNQALFELGLPNWRISYDVEKETKSGTISRGFTVLIDSPFSEGAVPWEAWSGGEGQRLRLAANLGLANLIQDRKGVTSFMEVWDEPSQHLSEKGVEDLLGVLDSRAMQQGKSIWVVDHHSLNYGGFSEVRKIIKDSKNGSWVE